MRLASYNIENLFERARVLSLETWGEGRKVLEAYAELTALTADATYSAATKGRMAALLKVLGIDKRPDGKLVTLRETEGRLVAYSPVFEPRISAGGRRDWGGWIELRRGLVNELATRNAAQVIRDIKPDVIGLVEVESRRALLRFSQMTLPFVGGAPFDQILLIDGNDDRGLHLALMSRSGYRPGWIRSHADDQDNRGSRIFTRDCPEFSVWTPSGAVVWILVNHFKSKGAGEEEATDAIRAKQAQAVRQIYERLRGEGAQNVAVIGDLNDQPSSFALAPLLVDADLKDVSSHPAFKSDGHLGTFGRGTAKDKLDYILLSPALFARVSDGGIHRKGVWGPGKVPPWEVYPEMRSSYDAASDHAAIWCDLDV